MVEDSLGRWTHLATSTSVRTRETTSTRGTLKEQTNHNNVTDCDANALLTSHCQIPLGIHSIVIYAEHFLGACSNFILGWRLYSWGERVKQWGLMKCSYKYLTEI